MHQDACNMGRRPPGPDDEAGPGALQAHLNRHTTTNAQREEVASHRQIVKEDHTDTGAHSRLLALPNGLQANIYQQAMQESEPINLRIYVDNQTDSILLCNIVATIGAKRMIKPPLLAACKCLRTVAGPIVFGNNTFSMMARQCDMEKGNALRRRWGEDVKHIRSLELIFPKSTRDDNPLLVYVGPYASPDVFFTMKVELLESGTLVLGFKRSDTKDPRLPEGEMCCCDLEKSAAAEHYEGKCGQRVSRIMTEFATYRLSQALPGRCEACRRGCLTIVEKSR